MKYEFGGQFKYLATCIINGHTFFELMMSVWSTLLAFYQNRKINNHAKYFLKDRMQSTWTAKQIFPHLNETWQINSWKLIFGKKPGHNDFTERYKPISNDQFSSCCISIQNTCLAVVFFSDMLFQHAWYMINTTNIC